MREFNLPTETFIGGWYIDPDLCDKINHNIENCDRSFDYDIPRQYSWCDLGEFDDDLCEDYCKELLDVIDSYKRKFPLSHEELLMWGFTRPRIQIYKAGESYSTYHCENLGDSGTILRHLAFMTYLNDIDDGGGTEFLHQDLITPARRGLTLLWPAHWTHYHRGLVAPSQQKNIITGWCCFFPTDKL